MGSCMPELLVLLGTVLLGLDLRVAGMRLHVPAEGPLPWLPDAIDKLLEKPEDGKLCLETSGRFEGRLSNTARMVNVLTRLALTKNITFKLPRSFTDFTAAEDLDHIFGTDPTCPAHNVREFKAICHAPPAQFPAKTGRCSLEEMELDTAAPQSVESRSCGCDRVIVVDASKMFWDHDYRQTFRVLRRRFWQTPHAIPQAVGKHHQSMHTMPAQVVVHVRLGDIETDCEKHWTLYNCLKKLTTEAYAVTLKALAAVLNPACMEVNVVTDGHLYSSDIQSILGNATGLGFKEPTVWTDAELSTRGAFEFLTAADILIFGSSGFGQLAGILAKDETARIGAPQPRTYVPAPLDFLPNTTHLSWLRDRSQAILEYTVDQDGARRALEANGAIQALISECRRWQG